MTRATMLRGNLAAAFLLLATSAQSARAATYKNVDCYCDPKTQGLPITYDSETQTGCICAEHYTLAKLGTMEFRFRCKSENAQPLARVAITERDGPTTCTVQVGRTNWGYVSQSCTNWSTLSTDALKLQGVCYLNGE